MAEPGAPPAPRVHHRAAGPEDRALVVGMLRELFDEIAPGPLAEESKRLLDADIAQALASPDVRIFLVEIDGAPAALARADVSTGFTVFRLREDKRGGYVDQMYVRKPFRRKQLGKLLLFLCESWLRARGVSHCLLHAAPDALGFYAGRGYQTTREMFKKL